MKTFLIITISIFVGFQIGRAYEFKIAESVVNAVMENSDYDPIKGTTTIDIYNSFYLDQYFFQSKISDSNLVKIGLNNKFYDREYPKY